MRVQSEELVTRQIVVTDSGAEARLDFSHYEDRLLMLVVDFVTGDQTSTAVDDIEDGHIFAESWLATAEPDEETE